MTPLLETLYDRFYVPDKSDESQEVAETCHKHLIETLSREERKIVLQLIDAKDHVAEHQSIDSFVRGFQIAWNLFVELEQYASAHPLVPVVPAHSLSKEGAGTCV